MRRKDDANVDAPDSCAQDFVEAAWALVCSRVVNAQVRSARTCLRLEVTLTTPGMWQLLELAERPARLAVRGAHERASHEETETFRAARRLAQSAVTRLSVNERLWLVRRLEPSETEPRALRIIADFLDGTWSLRLVCVLDVEHSAQVAVLSGTLAEAEAA
jgi:hypothetical protein